MELKSEELVNIINACGKNGVNCIKIGDIDIEFNGFVKVLETDYPEMVDGTEKIVMTDPNFKAQQDVEKELEDIEELLILDPAAYEERLLKGDLEESENNLDE